MIKYRQFKGEYIMYRIGEFSKMTDLSIRTLRYYDSIGLLIPYEIDRFTGYRYYTDDNLSEVYLIKLLRSVNFSLEEILMYKSCLNEEIIDNKIDELSDSINELESKIQKLNIIREEVNSKDNIIPLEKNKSLMRIAS